MDADEAVRGRVRDACASIMASRTRAGARPRPRRRLLVVDM